MKFFSFLLDRKFEFLANLSFFCLGIFVVTDSKYAYYFLTAGLIFDALFAFCLYKKSTK